MGINGFIKDDFKEEIMIYFLIFAFLLSTIFSLQKNRDTCIFIYGVSLSLLFLMAILVGVNSNRADYKSYLQIFGESPVLWDSSFWEFSKNAHTEIGYNILQSFFKGIFNSASIFFIFFCFVSLLFRYKFYRNFVAFADIGIVVMAFLSHEFLRKDCVQIRNGFASAIVLYSLVWLYKGDKLKFVLIVLFASCFHSVAMVALPLVIARTKISKLYYRFLTLLFVLSFIFSITFKVTDILFFFEQIGVLPKQIITYLSWTTYLVAMPITNPMLLKQIVFTAYFFIFKKDLLYSDKTIFFLFQVYLISTIYYLIFRDFEILAGRFGSLLYGVETPLLVLTINKSKQEILYKKLLLLAMYFGFLMLNFFTYTSVGFNIEWH